MNLGHRLRLVLLIAFVMASVLIWWAAFDEARDARDLAAARGFTPDSALDRLVDADALARVRAAESAAYERGGKRELVAVGLLAICLVVIPRSQSAK